MWSHSEQKNFIPVYETKEDPIFLINSETPNLPIPRLQFFYAERWMKGIMAKELCLFLCLLLYAYWQVAIAFSNSSARRSSMHRLFGPQLAERFDLPDFSGSVVGLRPS